MDKAVPTGRAGNRLNHAGARRLLDSVEQRVTGQLTGALKDRKTEFAPEQRGNGEDALAGG